MTGNNDDEYKCEMCGGWYRKAWSDAEAVEQSIKNAPAFDEASDALRAAGVWKPDDEDMIVVCDDCYQSLAPPGGWPADKDDASDLEWPSASATLSEVHDVWFGDPVDRFHATLDDNAEIQRAKPDEPGAFQVIWNRSGIITIDTGPAGEDDSADVERSRRNHPSGQQPDS